MIGTLIACHPFTFQLLLLEPISEAFVRCEGNVVRVQEVLAAIEGFRDLVDTVPILIEDDDLEDLKTVRDAVDYVLARL